MRFPYSSIISATPDGADFLLLRRPEIPITIFGPNGPLTLLALVDTGSDNTIFPKSVADHLQILIAESVEPAASVFGGSRVELKTGEVRLSIATMMSWRSPGVPWFAFMTFPLSKTKQ